MDDPKQRNEEEISEGHDTARFLNLGNTVELTFGTYQIQELDVYDLSSLVAGGLEVLLGLDTDKTNDYRFIADIVSKPETRQVLSRIFAKYCGEENTSLFEKLKPKDFNKLVPAIKKVTDFEEIRESFFVLGLQRFLPFLTSTESENSEELPT